MSFLTLTKFERQIDTISPTKRSTSKRMYNKLIVNDEKAPVAGWNQNNSAPLDKHMTLRESNVKNEHKQYLALSQRPSGSDQLRSVSSYADGVCCERRCTFEWHCRYGDSSTLWYGHIQQKFAGYTQSQRAYGAFVISTIRWDVKQQHS